VWDFFTNRGERKEQNDSYSPAGLITSYAGSSAPAGWLLCQGQEVSRTTYPALDSALALTYGAYTNGSGSVGTTHLRLPDLRGRVAVGNAAGSGNRTDTNGPLTGTGTVTGGSAMAATTLGAWSGVESVTLTASQVGLPTHTHSTSVGSHSHGVNQTSHSHDAGYSVKSVLAASTFYWNANGGNPHTWATQAGSISPTVTSRTSGYVTTRSNSEASAASSHSNIQACVVLNFIIKT
jgi:microcystin-dependent protein